MMVGQTSLIIGSYWLLISLAKDLSRDLYAVNKNKLKRLRIKTELIDFIKLQSNAKRLSEVNQIAKFSLFSRFIKKFQFFLFFRIVSNFLDAYEFNITTHFMWTILVICGNLLMIQIELV